MTTNANTFRQYLGTTHDGQYVICLRTRKGQAYTKAPIIATFPTYELMLQNWDMATTAESMSDVSFND